jgi:phosphatidylserine decarboxylase
MASWPGLVMAGLRALPMNSLSRLAGMLARIRLPGLLQRTQIRLFAAVFGVDLDAAREPVASYVCFQDFFTRALRDGVRPVDAAPDALVAPCDGSWGSSGSVKDGMLLQVKGRSYSLAALLADAQAAERFEGGSFATFYLSPRDYHRFHAPCAAQVVSASYVPGRLWPVNRIGLEGVDGLFAQNERICAHLDVEPPAADRGRAGRLCLVAVGATFVGSVRVTFDELATNRVAAGRTKRDYRDRALHLEKGEEWGRFEFGSTIVLLAEAGVLELAAQAPGSELRLGARIGTLYAAERQL